MASSGVYLCHYHVTREKHFQPELRTCSKYTEPL
jgi:hypothetical protein